MAAKLMQISDVLPQSMQTMKNCSAESKSKIITPEQFKKKVFEVCPSFEVDEFIKPIINGIYFYANNEQDPAGLFHPEKGILLWGPVGTGKSTIIKILGEVLRMKGQGYATLNCSYLATKFSADGLDALNTSTYNETENGSRPHNRAFDELGREPIPAKHYGNELNVMQYILQCRYELRSRVKTHITTNLKPEALEKVYGSYISDRMNEMFNVVELQGKSRRQ